MSKKVQFSDFIWNYFRTQTELKVINKPFMDDFGYEVYPITGYRIFPQRFYYYSFNKNEIIP